jgi:hypothetical protein
MNIQLKPQIDKSEKDSNAQSSFGDTSLSVTPKDVNERVASAQDMTQRDLQSDEPDQKQQDLLDEAIDLSFPASDPSAISSGRTRITVPKSTTNP